MKTSVLIMLLIAGVAGCTSKPVATTQEKRGHPAAAMTYGNYVAQRTEQLQRMGGPFTDPTVARQKAEAEANSRFGGSGGDTVTTTWTSSREAEGVREQEKLTDALDEMAKQKKSE